VLQNRALAAELRRTKTADGAAHPLPAGGPMFSSALAAGQPSPAPGVIQLTMWKRLPGALVPARQRNAACQGEPFIAPTWLTAGPPTCVRSMNCSVTPRSSNHAQIRPYRHGAAAGKSTAPRNPADDRAAPRP